MSPRVRLYRNVGNFNLSSLSLYLRCFNFITNRKSLFSVKIHGNKRPIFTVFRENFHDKVLCISLIFVNPFPFQLVYKLILMCYHFCRYIAIFYVFRVKVAVVQHF